MKKLGLYFACLLLWCCTAVAHQGHSKDQESKASLAISVAMDAKQQLWRASVNAGFVQVSFSQDLGKTFSPPVNVNQTPMKIAANGESRPKIAIASNGNLYLTWKAKAGKNGAGNIWFARSTDGGTKFDKPFRVHQDHSEVARRESTLQLSNDGKITVAWLDTRDAKAAKALGKPYRGTAIYYAVSQDQGQSFAPEQKLTDSSCECCRMASTTKPDGTVVLMWRHVFEGMQRDHMMAEIPKAGATADLHRASFGRWQIEGCPHHGGALARGGEGEQWWGYHYAYFDGKDKKPGLYYSRMDGEAWARVPAKQFGDFAKQAGHPVLWAKEVNGKELVWRVWQEIEAGQVEVLGQFSEDGGRSWGKEQILASLNAKIDYPQLIGLDSSAYLIINTMQSGLIVKPLISQ